MANEYKTLGQSAPSAGVLTPLYTVPPAKAAVLSDFGVCNQSGTPTTFRMSVAVNGAADDPKQYLYYDVAIAGNDALASQRGLTLGAGDVIRVYAAAATLSFSVSGTEIS